MTFKSMVSIVAVSLALTSPTNAFADGHADASTVVATVNGTEVTLGHMLALRQRLPAQYQQLAPEVLFDGILDQLVQQTLLGETVESLSTISQITLENEMRALKASDAIQQVIEEAVSEEALQAAYERLYGETEPESEFNASHILVETEEEAKALVAELEAGADFAELAKEKSTGPSGPGGGQLGWFGKGAMVPPFEEAVLEMEVGAISAPVQTQFGWHVIKLNETRVKDAPPFDTVRGQLTENIQRSAVEARVAELTEGAEITRATVEDIDPAVLNDMSLLEN